MGQQAEGVGIPLEVEEVLPASTLLLHLALPVGTIPLLKVCTDRPLSAVAEGWVAHVVC